MGFHCFHGILGKPLARTLGTAWGRVDGIRARPRPLSLRAKRPTTAASIPARRACGYQMLSEPLLTTTPDTQGPGTRVRTVDYIRFYPSLAGEGC